jgi:hypothetical protein
MGWQCLLDMPAEVPKSLTWHAAKRRPKAVESNRKKDQNETSNNKVAATMMKLLCPSGLGAGWGRHRHQEPIRS